jgi:hypothetical protein
MFTYLLQIHVEHETPYITNAQRCRNRNACITGVFKIGQNDSRIASKNDGVEQAGFENCGQK